MKKLAAVAFVVFACASALAAQTSATFTGKWEGTMSMRNPDGSEAGSRPLLLVLTQEGKELKGTAGPPDQQLEIQKGAVADGRATFQVQSPNRLYTFTLTIEKERLQGEMTSDGLPAPLKVDAGRAK